MGQLLFGGKKERTDARPSSAAFISLTDPLPLGEANVHDFLLRVGILWPGALDDSSASVPPGYTLPAGFRPCSWFDRRQITCPANTGAEIRQQFESITMAFRNCFCRDEGLGERIRSVYPDPYYEVVLDPPTAASAAAAIKSLRIRLRKFFAETCARHGGPATGWCTLPLVWYWSTTSCDAHMTLLGFNHNQHQEWFYDPMEFENPPLSRYMADAFRTESLLPGYHSHVIAIGPSVDGDALQFALEPDRGSDLECGCCSSVCMLFAALIWRYNVMTVGDVSVLALALYRIARRVRASESNPEWGAWKHDCLVQRCYGWQWRLSEAAAEEAGHERLLALCGLKPVDALDDGRCHALTTASRTIDDAGQSVQSPCGRPVLPGEVFCAEHHAALVSGRRRPRASKRVFDWVDAPAAKRSVDPNGGSINLRAEQQGSPPAIVSGGGHHSAMSPVSRSPPSTSVEAIWKPPTVMSLQDVTDQLPRAIPKIPRDDQRYTHFNPTEQFVKAVFGKNARRLTLGLVQRLFLYGHLPLTVQHVSGSTVAAVSNLSNASASDADALRRMSIQPLNIVAMLMDGRVAVHSFDNDGNPIYVKHLYPTNIEHEDAPYESETHDAVYVFYN